jgi:hypothetical protein
MSECLAAGLLYLIVSLDGLAFGELCIKHDADIPVAKIARTIGHREMACPKTGTADDLARCLSAEVYFMPHSYRLVIDRRRDG